MDPGVTRVVHVVPALFDQERGVLGGAERYAYELARHMAQRVPTRLVAFGKRGGVEQVGALEVRVLGPAWFVRGEQANPFSLSLFSALRGASVVHCHQQHIVASSVAAAYARLTRRHVFVTELGGGGWDISGYLRTDSWYHGHLHISEYSRRVFGHAEDPTARVILGGVDAERFRPYGPPQRDGSVLYVGRVLPHKGVNDLIDAVPPTVPVEIVGHVREPRFLAELKRRASGKSVTFRAGVGDAELVRAYRKATCVVLPSVYRDLYGSETRVPELLGQTALEAMACGTPVVCTSVGSLPEVVQDGATGFVIPPNSPDQLWQAIARLREDPSLVESMGRARRARVLERFNWPAVVDRCLEAYAGA
jgi:glycosyltransferase involved in cell wall biosynthesis